MPKVSTRNVINQIIEWVPESRAFVRILKNCGFLLEQGLCRMIDGYPVLKIAVIIHKFVYFKLYLPLLTNFLLCGTGLGDPKNLGDMKTL